MLRILLPNSCRPTKARLRMSVHATRLRSTRDDLVGIGATIRYAGKWYDFATPLPRTFHERGSKLRLYATAVSLLAFEPMCPRQVQHLDVFLPYGWRFDSEKIAAKRVSFHFAREYDTAMWRAYSLASSGTSVDTFAELPHVVHCWPK